MLQSLTPHAFIAKWKPADLSERAACQEHFIDLCRMLGHPTPAEADPTGEEYTFERGVEKSEGGNGWADVWKRGYFGWEYKGKHKDLKAAYAQLQLYRESLENPPLLVVCDLNRFEIHTNFTGCAKRVYAFDLDSLDHPVNLGTLRKLFHDPQALRPEHTTEDITVEAAKTFATMIDGWRDRGITGHDAAHFAMKLLFCMFAEDIDLLPDRTFRSTIEGAKKDPARLAGRLKSLFDCMASGGDYGPVSVPWFNGGLFKAGEPVPSLLSTDVERLITLNAYDWASVEPSIFGTLFERTLDPAKRSQIGAHYTSREDILTLLEPVLMAPLRREWAAVQSRAEELWPQLADKKKAAKARKELDRLLRDFVERLAAVKILDPSCGSGNFLYVAITLLLDLEKEVIAKAATFGTTLLPQVRPSQLYGLEINPYAAELAQVVIWIGYLQWMHFNGFAAPRDPILQPIDTIRNTDAIIDLTDPQNPKEPEWPEADVIVGNPPFLGRSFLRSELSVAYVAALFAVYNGRLPPSSDLCCYWFERARAAIEQGRSTSAGLLATQGIRGGKNREVLSRIAETGTIFFAISDKDWILDGANVHISIVGFGGKSEIVRTLDGRSVSKINSDLSPLEDVTTSQILKSNRGICSRGSQKRGAFDIPRDVAESMILAPINAHGVPNSDVVVPYWNGMDLTRRSRNMWIIDFGSDRSHDDAAQYELPFEYVRAHVHSERMKNNDARLKTSWWLHGITQPAMRAALSRIPRCCVTARVAKYRLFAWIALPLLPDDQLIVFARDDDFYLGVLHSRPHELWALKRGTRLETRPRYTPTTCFETFPLPEPTAAQRDAISAAAKELDTLRTNWLNPPEWTREEVLTFPGSVDGPWTRYVTEPNAKGIGTVRYPRVVPADAAAAKKLAKRTLTNLYNERPTWLDLAHKRLDEAVFAAYAWPTDLSDEDLLARLLALNLERAGAE
ncbi:DNA methyltransferase yeeA [Planctomycetia bacterium]|nr:DNA methyltransferase yeeA [Planctomycetia bacterium]